MHGIDIQAPTFCLKNATSKCSISIVVIFGFDVATIITIINLIIASTTTIIYAYIIALVNSTTAANLAILIIDTYIYHFLNITIIEQFSKKFKLLSIARHYL